MSNKVRKVIHSFFLSTSLDRISKHGVFSEICNFTSEYEWFVILNRVDHTGSGVAAAIERKNSKYLDAVQHNPLWSTLGLHSVRFISTWTSIVSFCASFRSRLFLTGSRGTFIHPSIQLCEWRGTGNRRLPTIYNRWTFSVTCASLVLVQFVVDRLSFWVSFDSQPVSQLSGQSSTSHYTPKREQIHRNPYETTVVAITFVRN